MNSKQRVKKVLMMEEPDRVPLDYWADRIVSERVMETLGIDDIEQLYNYLNIDFRFIEGVIYKGPELQTFEDGSRMDIWGVRRKKVSVDDKDPGRGSYEHVVENPFARAENIKDIENYGGWPSPDWYDYSCVGEMAGKYSDFAVVCGGDRLNRTAQLKPAMYLRGVEQIMLDLSLNPEMVEAMIERFVCFFLEYNKRIFDNAAGKIDIFFNGDDFGTQNGMIMSKEMWRRFFKPGFKKFIELAHGYGIKVMHHTCGSIEQLIPEFIDCGLDILQSLQPQADGMDFGWQEENITVIDCDLGQSGAESSGRDGFKQLVADVGSGEVGAVASIECSRLSRSSRDWGRLMEICAITQTVLIDDDGVYDPNNFNEAVSKLLLERLTPMAVRNVILSFGATIMFSLI